MRTSERKTTVATLRAFLGIKDREIAELLSCSVWTIHSLETGRLKLSGEFAAKIAAATAVSINWLLEGDPKGPIVSEYGGPYTHQVYEDRRSKGEIPFHAHSCAVIATNLYVQIRAVLESAIESKKSRLAAYKCSKAIRQLVDEFGIPERFLRYQAKPLDVLLEVFSADVEELMTYGPAIARLRRRKKQSSRLKRKV